MTAIDRPWVGLANACYIDAVLADVNARPAVWSAARHAAWSAVQGAAQGAAQGAVQSTARGAAWWPVTALITWDSAADLLDLPAS